MVTGAGDRKLLFTDGGARGNPGPAGIGFVLTRSSGGTIEKGSRFIGRATNNLAEYLALIFGLETALRLKISELACFLDSELVVKQLNGLYRVKDQKLKTYYAKVAQLRRQFRSLTFTAIPREKNRLADELVNEAIDRES